jgi:hypothetical protein
MLNDILESADGRSEAVARVAKGGLAVLARAYCGAGNDTSMQV